MSAKAVTYLVSGDISPCQIVLRRSGRRVRHDTEVNELAAVAINAGRHYVVLAHGRRDGTVMWSRSDKAQAIPWLWVGMPQQPKSARIYLYSCHAGRKLPRHLKHCECFGHIDVVPMPDGRARDVVLAFLDEVDRVMRSPQFDAKKWRSVLAAYVNKAFVKEVENPTGLLNAQVLLQLRASLGYVDD